MGLQADDDVMRRLRSPHSLLTSPPQQHSATHSDSPPVPPRTYKRRNDVSGTANTARKPPLPRRCTYPLNAAGTSTRTTGESTYPPIAVSITSQQRTTAWLEPNTTDTPYTNTWRTQQDNTGTDWAQHSNRSQRNDVAVTSVRDDVITDDSRLVQEVIRSQLARAEQQRTRNRSQFESLQHEHDVIKTPQRVTSQSVNKLNALQLHSHGNSNDYTAPLAQENQATSNGFQSCDSVVITDSSLKSQQRIHQVTNSRHDVTHTNLQPISENDDYGIPDDRYMYYIIAFQSDVSKRIT